MIDEMPERAFDVGIAEQHAVTLAAGMATQGMVVFCNIYSTFMQRAYDQIIHDVALQNLPVIFCLDRAGLVGEDGATHHGTFDIAYLRCVPNIIIAAPMNEIELRNLLYTSQLELDNPIAIRYPRGRGVTIDWKQDFKKINIGKGIELQKGSKVAILSTGHIGNLVSDVISNLSENTIGHYHFPFIKPLDKTLLDTIFNSYTSIITIEDGTIVGGFGSAISEYATENNLYNPIKTLGIPDVFIEHGNKSELYKEAGIDSESILATIKKYI